MTSSISISLRKKILPVYMNMNMNDLKALKAQKQAIDFQVEGINVKFHLICFFFSCTSACLYEYE